MYLVNPVPTRHYNDFSKKLFPGLSASKVLFTGLSWRCTPTSKQRQNLFLPLFSGRSTLINKDFHCFEGRPPLWFLVNTRLQNKTTHAFKTNQRMPSKQTKKKISKDFPPLLKPFLIGWKKITTPWRCPKIRSKKFRSILEIFYLWLQITVVTI